MMTRRQMLAATGTVALGAPMLAACDAGPSYDDAASAIRAAKAPRDDPDLAFLVHHAVLAANSHNTQPWLFGRTGDIVRVLPDLWRRTPAVDGDDHHLFASLGCAAENLAIAAAACGKAAEVAFVDEDDGRIEIDISANTTRTDPLFTAIAGRQCTRSDYDGRTMQAADLEALVTAARIEGCEVILLTHRLKIEQALELIVAANSLQLSDPAFMAELKNWVRFNETSAVASRDGLFSGCTGNPSVPDWLGRLIFSLVLRPGSENDRYARQIRSSAGLAVFVTENNDKAHWIKAGRAYQRFALQATALGVRHAFLNQPLEVNAMRPEFASWLGTGGRRPDLVVRFGYAPPMPRSLRRPVDAVII